MQSSWASGASCLRNNQHTLQHGLDDFRKQCGAQSNDAILEISQRTRGTAMDLEFALTLQVPTIKGTRVPRALYGGHLEG